MDVFLIIIPIIIGFGFGILGNLLAVGIQNRFDESMRDKQLETIKSERSKLNWKIAFACLLLFVISYFSTSACLKSVKKTNEEKSNYANVLERVAKVENAVKNQPNLEGN